MAGSINKAILIGNLGKDPEVRRLENGNSVASFSLATSEVYTDRSTGEKKETTDWHDVVLWRGLAEVAEKYLRKGTKVYVEGKIKKRSWQDKDGNTRYTVEIIGDNLTILSKAETSSQPAEKVCDSIGTPETPSTIEGMESHPDDNLPF
jgi:single-strand DNA-binding protein